MLNNKPTLRVSSISASYSNVSGKIDVFSSISFALNEGDILAIFGPNGCGKSTLLRVIGGLKIPRTGTISYDGGHLDQDYLSIIPQDFRASFFNWTSLAGNINLTQPSPFKLKRQYREKIEKLKSDFGINLDVDLRPHECSGGMLQQGALLRGFINSPRVLLADEPFSALDVNISGKIRKRFVQKVKDEGTIVVAVMHSIEEIVEIADYVLAIPNMPYASIDKEGHSKAVLLDNKSPSKHSSFEENNFVDIARNIISPD